MYIKSTQTPTFLFSCLVHFKNNLLGGNHVIVCGFGILSQLSWSDKNIEVYIYVYYFAIGVHVRTVR